jgi:hypothetical protein
VDLVITVGDDQVKTIRPEDGQDFKRLRPVDGDDGGIGADEVLADQSQQSAASAYLFSRRRVFVADALPKGEPENSFGPLADVLPKLKGEFIGRGERILGPFVPIKESLRPDPDGLGLGGAP